MAVWVIGDLHLSFGIPNKSMDLFGIKWQNHAEKIKQHWLELISKDDLVLIPGDICWALKPLDALPSLTWIHELPGTKVFIKGNHDYWWSGSIAKLNAMAPPSCHLIHNASFNWNGITIAGTRLWDIPGLSFNEIIDFKNPPQLLPKDEKALAEEAKIYQRELGRLEVSLQSMPPNAEKKIVMTHYPPIGLNFQETEASQLLEKYGVDICVFGHLHQIKPNLQVFGKYRGIQYILSACDYLDDFKPLRLL